MGSENLKTATQLLQQYTFEPVKPKLRVEQRSLAVQHQDRAIPFGHFKIRLKNINNQQSYLLELRQALQLTTATGLQLRLRLHGVHVQYARHLVPSGYHILASLTIKATPQASHGFVHKQVHGCLFGTSHRPLRSEPTHSGSALRLYGQSPVGDQST